jgi:hypothetical protein
MIFESYKHDLSQHFSRMASQELRRYRTPVAPLAQASIHSDVAMWSLPAGIHSQKCPGKHLPSGNLT